VLKLTEPHEAFVVGNVGVLVVLGKLVVTVAATFLMLAAPLEVVVFIPLSAGTGARLDVFKSAA